jgi:hypothetical protein
MADPCKERVNALVEALLLLRDKAENGLSAAKLPVSADVHVAGLTGILVEVVREAEAAVVGLIDDADTIESIRAENERLRSLAEPGERFEVWISGDHLDALRDPTDGSAVIWLRDPECDDDDFDAPATLIVHTREPS